MAPDLSDPRTRCGSLGARCRFLAFFAAGDLFYRTPDACSAEAAAGASGLMADRLQGTPKYQVTPVPNT